MCIADLRGSSACRAWISRRRRGFIHAAGVPPSMTSPRVCIGRSDLAANRDFKVPQSNRFVCGFNPSHPADDTLLAGRVRRDGHTDATIVNYACHPTTLGWENKLISPDYVGALRETVEQHTAGAPCIFLQGASGELAPAEQYFTDTQVADGHGRRVGFAALSALEAMDSPGTNLSFSGVVESGAPLGVWRRGDQ